MKQFFCFILYIMSFGLCAQTQLTDSLSISIKQFDVLPDQNYSLEQVLKDKRLNFVPQDKIADYRDSPNYWLRFIIKNELARPPHFYVNAHPNFHNTLYNYNPDTKRWDNTESGFAIADGRRLPGLFPYFLDSNRTDTIFIKMQLSAIPKSGVAIKPWIQLVNASAYEKQESVIFITWFSTCAIIIIFFFYNLYIFFVFKDNAYLYYLLIQLGAIFYITSYRRYFNILFSDRYFTTDQTEIGLYIFDLNIILMQFALVLIISGFVQYARTYLETARLVPKLDRILKTLNYTFCTILLTSTAVTVSGIYYSYNITVHYTNLLIVAMLLLTLVTAIICWRMKLKQAKYFLAANSFAVFIVLAITITFLTHEGTNGPDFLPNIAVLSQTLAFAIALVSRVNVIKEELKAREIEAQLLRKDNEQIQIKNRLIALENEYVNAQMAIEKSEKEKLHEKLEFNQRELASTTLYLFQKNEMLSTLQKQIEELPKTILPDQNIQQIKSTIKSNLFLDADWEKFKLHFEKVHPDFFSNLKEKHPTLTAYEIRLCAYFHLQLSPKEIAGLLNINSTSVHRAKTRLNKKMNITDSPN